MNKKIIVSLLLVFTLVLTACGGGGEKASGAKDDFVIAVQADATSMDPNVFNDDYSDLAMRQVYETLLAKDEEGKIYNLLAENVEEKDGGLTYTITIREGVKFHSGKDLTIDDVIWNFERVIQNEKSANVYKNIIPESVKKIDDNKMELKLEQPQGSFMEVLTSPYLAIMPKDVQNDIDVNTEEDGTGPFKMVSWEPQNEMKFERFDDYWGDKPAFKNLTFRIIPEATNRTVELESGGVDMAFNIAPNDIKKVEENEDLQIFRKGNYAVHFIQFNISKAPFNNIKAREAVSYALDLNDIVNSIYMGVGEIATSPISPRAKYSIASEIEPKTRDIEKAKALLAEAGVPEGTEILFYVNDNQQRQDVATIVQAQLKEVGLNVKVEKFEWGAYMDTLRRKEEDMYIMSWSPSIVDPDQYLYSPFHSDKAGQGPNFGMYQNPEVDALINEGLLTVDDTKRAEIYRKAQEIILNDIPRIDIWYGEQVYGANKIVNNFKMLPEYAQVFKTVTFGE